MKPDLKARTGNIATTYKQTMATNNMQLVREQSQRLRHSHIERTDEPPCTKHTNSNSTENEYAQANCPNVALKKLTTNDPTMPKQTVLQTSTPNTCTNVHAPHA